MGLFSKIVKTAIHTAAAPIAVVADIATCGGVTTGQTEPYTAKALKKVVKDAKEVGQEVEKL